MNKIAIVKKIFRLLVVVFACIGFFLTIGYVAIKLGWTKVAGVVDDQREYFQTSPADQSTVDQAWITSDEWRALKAGIIKDEADIEKAAKVAGISPRMIAAPLVSEQMRLFTDDREMFKNVFSPLKVLGIQSQFSLGVMGIKENTAREIEENLKDSTSTFYLGQAYEHLLDFSTTTASIQDSERFARLTDGQTRYYSYLYGALYEKEVIEQWKNANIDISNQPNILATLFNIGFSHSLPHPYPQTGGAQIIVNGTTYSFGGLASSFYYSDQLPELTK